MHNCTTDNGSFGSPILNLQTNKVIGIHNKSSTNYNIGTLLKLPIKDFINPLTSPGEGVTVFTYPYLSEGAPVLGEAKGLIRLLWKMKKI